MLSVNNLSVSFGGFSLFDHITFNLGDKEKIGLVGRNGAGKSTLLKILSGLQAPSEGTLVTPEGYTIGYLPQEQETTSTRTVFEEALTAFGEVMGLKSETVRLEEELRLRTDFESRAYQQLLKRHHEAYERFSMLGGDTLHVHVEKTLTGLGFESSDFTRSLKEFSRGWQMRVEIAKILLRNPDLILLDEPTNHLDIESIQWLEEFLISCKGAVILVSHDRAFLDNVTRRTIEITLGKIYDYRANYSGFVKLREERMESQIATYNNQQRQVRQVERFIERFRYKATKASQVQSRIRMLEKMEMVEPDQVDDAAIHFTFPPAPHSGKIILEAAGLGKQFGSRTVLHELNFQVIRGDRIAFVGRNGEGKTTLSKIIARQLDYAGQLKFGHQVITGYYAQDQADSLDPGKTVFQTIDDIATGDIRPKIRTILGGFLFSGEDIDKKVRVLSGGEKSRLSIARLLLTPSNFLVLDEPTNHLDMRSKDILKNALLQFTGTLIIVSHDRDFLQGLTNRVFEFRNGGIREYLGDIYDFLGQRRLRDLSALEQARQTEQAGSRPAGSDQKAAWEQRKSVDRETRKVRNQIARCEEEIAFLEQKIAASERILGDPGTHREVVTSGDIYAEYNAWQVRLKEEMNRWEALHGQLEAMIRGAEDRQTPA